MRNLVDREPEVGAEVGRGREAYGTFGGDGAIRWRKTFVPGPSGLDDAPQVVVEVYQPGPHTGTTSTYTYVTDEMGTTLAVVAEDEGGTPTEPPVPVRYLYTPYGQAHAETGPELLRVRFDATATSVDSGTGGAVTQVVPDTTEAAPGALVLTWSSSIAEASLPGGLHVEHLVAGEGWVAMPADELAVGTSAGSDPAVDTSTELRVLRIWGWQEATSYRLRLTHELEDRLGRPFGRSETLQWTVPAAPSEEADVPPPQYEQRYPRRYESYEAAGTTAGGRFPGGQSRLFQGLWTDPVTGISYARARWLDTRTGHWLSEDPLFDIDSPNLYAFVGWQPTMATDPFGTCKLGLPCPAWAREAVRQAEFNLTVQWEMAKGVSRDAGAMLLGAADFVTLGNISRQRASIGTFLNTEGSLIERGNAANEAGDHAQLAVVSLGFSEAEDKSQHLENLVGVQAIQDAGTLLGTAVGEGNPEAALAGVGKLAEGSGQMAGTILAVYAPAEAGVARLRAGGVSNPVPPRMTRVVEARFASSPRLGGPGARDVFVTASDDIAGIGTSSDLARRLTLLDNAGRLRQGPFCSHRVRYACYRCGFTRL